MVQWPMDLGDISGAVVLVARNGQIAFVDVQGAMDIETKKPMTALRDLQIASMTKPVIGTAVTMMLDEGKVEWAIVSKFIPEFRVMKAAMPEDPAEGLQSAEALHSARGAREDG